MYKTHPFLFYWLVAGLIEFAWHRFAIWQLQFKPKKKAKIEAKMRDFVWETGISESQLMFIFDLVLLLLGGITLPYLIFVKIYAFFTGREFLSGEPIEKE